MKTTCEPSADITLTTPADLVSAIPYLVGYVPHDSFVIVGMTTGHIATTLRVDLPAADEPASSVRVDTDALRRNEVRAAVIAGYGSADRVTPCIDHVRALFTAADIQLVEALRVTDGLYWSYVCQNPACCRPQGNPVNGNDSPVDASFTYGGMQALPSRAAVVDQMAPVTGTTRATVTRATNQVRKLLSDDEAMIGARTAIRKEGNAIMTRTLAMSRALPDMRETVQLGFALTDYDLQTKALALTDQRGARASLDLWLWLTRHVDPAFRPVPAALLGFAAWRCGNGALATEAVRRALTDDPQCYIATVLGHLLDKQIPPGSIPQLQSATRCSPE